MNESVSWRRSGCLVEDVARDLPFSLLLLEEKEFPVLLGGAGAVGQDLHGSLRPCPGKGEVVVNLDLVDGKLDGELDVGEHELVGRAYLVGPFRGQ